jgi:molybdate transport system regulatory protein
LLPCVTFASYPFGAARMTFNVKFRLRIYRDEGIAIGPGKVALVEAIAETGSISAAARRLGMSYRRAWLLVDELNRALRKPAVVGIVGGRHGGGATLTKEGEELVRRYRAIEVIARQAAATDLASLTRLLAP